ncbi:MAG: hypothetical protein KJ906_01185 [Nanoarchaeota archaeon]|nr:hypothetical protein [Nanoarchaeota archaeon]
MNTIKEKPYRALEMEVEKYLKINKINYKTSVQVIGKFKPDFLLYNNIMLEIKWIDDLGNKQKDPTYVRNMLSQATFRNQLLQKIYPKDNWRNILIIKRASGRYSATNVIYGNIIFDLFLPFEHMNKLNGFLERKYSKEEIFFEILDDMFNKYWIKERSTFPSTLYHFLSLLTVGKYETVSDFIENEGYKLSNKLDLYSSLGVLEKINIIKKIKCGRRTKIELIEPRWRYIVYLVIMGEGTFKSTNIDDARKIWNSIITYFSKYQM